MTNSFDAPYDKKAIRYVEYGDSTLIVDVSDNLEITNDEIRANLDKELKLASETPWFAPAGLNRGVIENIENLVCENGKWTDEIPKSSALTKINLRREINSCKSHLLEQIQDSLADALDHDLFAPNNETTVEVLTKSVKDYLKSFTHKDHINQTEVHCYQPTWEDYYPNIFTRELAQEAVKLHGNQHTKKLPEHLKKYPYLQDHGFNIKWQENNEDCFEYYNAKDLPFDYETYSENDALAYLESVYPSNAIIEPVYHWYIKNPEGAMEVAFNFVPNTTITDCVQFKAQISTTNMTTDSIATDINKTCNDDLSFYVD